MFFLLTGESNECAPFHPKDLSPESLKRESEQKLGKQKRKSSEDHQLMLGATKQPKLCKDELA